MARSSSLLDDDRQIHARVDGAVEMVGPCRGKGANHLLVVPSELHVDRRRVGLFQRLGSVIVPGAIGNMMWHRHIIDQRDTAAFADGHRRLCEGLEAHVNCNAAFTCACIACGALASRGRCGATRGACASTCDEQHGSRTAQQQDDNYFFDQHDYSFSLQQWVLGGSFPLQGLVAVGLLAGLKAIHPILRLLGLAALEVAQTAFCPRSTSWDSERPASAPAANQERKSGFPECTPRCG